MIPKINTTSAFDTFQSYCASTLEKTGYSDYCKPIRIHLEQGISWLTSQSEPLLRKGKWGWDATGRQFGKGGQIVLVLLIVGIACNLFKSPKKEEGKHHRISYAHPSNRKPLVNHHSANPVCSHC